jgi:hypothetical protein
MERGIILLLDLLGVSIIGAPAGAEITMDWVTLGDVGNVGGLSGVGAGGHGNDRICGVVDYTYRIGKYEVTNSHSEQLYNRRGQYLKSFYM